MRLVEHEGAKIGVFNCDGTLYAIEDRCSHDDGPLAEGEFDAADLHRRVPPPRLPLRPDHRQAEDAPRLCSGANVPGRHRGRHHHPGGRIDHGNARGSRREKRACRHQLRLQGEVRLPRSRRPATPTKRRRGSAARSSNRSPTTRTSRSGCATSGSRRSNTSNTRPTPNWGGNLGQIDFDDIHYFVRASEKNSRDWSEVPEDIKNTFDRLGIPEAERKFLSGVGAQYESEVVYHQVNEKLEAQGVIFTDMDTALREHEDLVREYWATIIPPNDNKLAALNSAVWSGGSFVYVPAGVKVEMPLQAYFRINTENMGQFERTLIICEEGADVHYIEGCTAPVYSTDSLHSAVVEIVAKKSSRVRYTTVQNWSQNVFNLVTKRAVAHEKATMEWVDCNLGSKLTMKYPSIYLLGPRSPRRDPLDRLRRRGPAPGRRRQDHPRRAAHLVLDLLQVDLQGRRPRHLPRPARSRRRGQRIAAPRSSATRCSSTRTRARTPTRRSGSTRTTPTSATRRPSRKSATSSSSTCRAAGSTRRRPRR